MTNAEIQVGEYVRTIDGKIGIFDHYNSRQKNSIFYSHYDCFVKFQGIKFAQQKCSENIKSHSFNIIDLIEVGDYVNGLPVRFVENGRIDIGQEENYFWLKNEHIVSVVTHEQMKSMEYKVGGEDEQSR